MTKKIIKCSICEEVIEKDSETYQTLKGEVACSGCWESEWEVPSTVINFTPNQEIISKSFTENFGDVESNEIPVPIKLQKWASIGMRGRTDWEYLPGFVEIVDGWVTNFPDDTVPGKWKLVKMFEELNEHTIVPPVDLYWIFGKTSNIFATASALVVRKKDIETIKDWLNEINGGIEGLQEDFN